ncbi:MAG: 6-phospho-beta-glucosidase, partial [Thermotogaceae bacterium]|nr:6-phospho-beta-glucosidase [Thermotogaceae bacterium]
MKIAVIGGGSSYTPELLTGFLEMPEDIDEIFLFDIEEGKEKLN